jgi:hypothetical protein
MYDREEMFDKLVECLDEIGITAYAAYELTGEFDVLLRVWIPVSQIGGFPEKLKEAVHPSDKREFRVAEAMRHWPWRDDRSQVPQPCDVDALAETTSPGDIEILNRLSDETHRGDVARRSSTDTEPVDRLMGANAITDLPAGTGIRLFIRLKAQERLEEEVWEQTTRNVIKTLDKITRPKGKRRAISDNGRFTIDEVSLYTCNDRSLLVLCRIPYTSWHSMRDNLIEPLASTPGVRQTTTMPALSQNFVRSRDYLVLDDQAAAAVAEKSPPDSDGEGPEEDGVPIPPPPSVPPGVSEYLERPENKDFEAKGSAFAPLEQWLSRPLQVPRHKNLKESPGFFRDTIAKTIVAMLNSGGGALLIGVLERDKFAKHKSELLKLRIAQMPDAGRFCLLGLRDPTFQESGWDGFDLKFNRLLKESIQGEVADLVSVYRDFYSKETLALILVDYPGMRDGFFLRDGKERRFMVRRGGSTDELQGPDILHYIERKKKQERLAEGGKGR